MTAFCISDPKIVSRPPVTGRDTSGRKVTFWGQKSGIEAILSRPLKGGRDRKSAFLQSKFGVCHDVTTSRPKKADIKRCRKTYIFAIPYANGRDSRDSRDTRRMLRKTE